MESVANQLSGSEETVDASALNLSAMGSMGGMGMDRGDREESRKPASDIQSDGREQQPQRQEGMAMPQGMERPGGSFDAMAVRQTNQMGPILISVAVLAAGLIFALCYRRRK